MRRYRESVLAGLVEDGYTVIDAIDADDDESGAVIESVKAASVDLYTAECKAIADSPTISDAELKKLQDTSNKGQLVSKVGKAIGVTDGEPYWNGYLGQWQVWVNNGSRVYVCGVRLVGGGVREINYYGFN